MTWDSAGRAARYGQKSWWASLSWEGRTKRKERKARETRAKRVAGNCRATSSSSSARVRGVAGRKDGKERRLP